MKFLVACLFVLISLAIVSCNTTEPPNKLAPELKLELEDVSCTEAWIRFSSTNIQTPSNITLFVDNTPNKTINLTTADTLLYVDSLLPNQTYKIVAAMQQSNNASNELSVTTLDTTSHNFSWQTFTFGEHSTSILYDVAIINENDIWAVGEIYMNDSLGNPDPNSYNAVHWDGSNWELERINMRSSCNPVTYPPLKAIWAFSTNDIVVTSGGSIGWFNGAVNKTDCNIRPVLSGSINRFWGSSSNDLYAVGNDGNIVHYNGNGWTKIESGTDLNIYDIWGGYDEINNEYKILAVAANRTVNFDKKILRIEKTGKVDSLSVTGIPYSIHGIWFKNKTNYVAGSGLYKKYNIDTPESWISLHSGLSNYYLDAIRGNELNDIVACGAFGELLHFNGVTWKSYIDVTYINGAFGSIDIKGNIVCCAGLKDGKAIIVKGIKD